MLSTARMTGQSLGAALVALIFSAAGPSGTTTTLIVAAGFAALAAFVSLTRIKAHPRPA